MDPAHSMNNAQFMGSAMNTMMLTQHISSQLNRLGNSNSTIMETLLDNKFLVSTMMIIIQMLLIGLISLMVTPLNGVLVGIMKSIVYVFKYYIIKPLVKYIIFIYEKITRKKINYTIKRTIQTLTSNFKRNQELFTRVLWYLTQQKMNITEPLNDAIKENKKELYYDNPESLAGFTSDCNKDIKICLLPMMGSDLFIEFNGYKIYYYINSEVVDIHTDIEGTKRNNLYIKLETKSEDLHTTILEEFVKHCVVEYNMNIAEWKQKIYRNAGGEWKDSVESSSPKSIESIILKNNKKEEITTSLDFFVNNREFYIERSIRHKFTVLIMGQPGTGKT